MIDRQIGRELQILSNSLEHLEILRRFYSTFDTYNSSEELRKEDESLRYWSIQHVCHFIEIPFEEREYGKYVNIQLLKLEVIEDLLKNLPETIIEFRTVAKQRILEIFRSKTKYSGKIIKAIHNYVTDIEFEPGKFSRITVFDIEIDSESNSVIIHDIYEQRYLEEGQPIKFRDRYQKLIGIVL